MRKITFSVAINSNIYDLIPKVKQYMQDNGLSSFSNGSVSRGDAVQYCIKKFAETLGFEVNDNGLDLEFVTADQLEDKQTKDGIENRLCSLLARDAWDIQEEFVQGDYRKKGVDIFEYCTMKNINWRESLNKDKVIMLQEPKE